MSKGLWIDSAAYIRNLTKLNLGKLRKSKAGYGFFKNASAPKTP